MELHSEKEASALGIRRVLIRRDDVRTELAEQPGDGRDDPMPVRAGDEQPGVVGQPPVGVIVTA